jgi:hypothetical protein
MVLLSEIPRERQKSLNIYMHVRVCMRVRVCLNLVCPEALANIYHPQICLL